MIKLAFMFMLLVALSFVLLSHIYFLYFGISLLCFTLAAVEWLLFYLHCGIPDVVVGAGAGGGHRAVGGNVGSNGGFGCWCCVSCILWYSFGLVVWCHVTDSK